MIYDSMSIMNAKQLPVIIVGAGPTGLVLALWLTKFGVPIRIFDKSSGPGETSRAMGVQARTLEFYQQIGIAEEIVDLGIPVEQITFRKNQKDFAASNFRKMGEGMSPFPYLLSFPQDTHEKVLIRHLSQLGIEVERNTEVLSYQDEKSLRVQIQKKGGPVEEIDACYLCGCDGASSTIRHQLGFQFPGGTYQQVFFVADVISEQENKKEVRMNLFDDDFCLLFPIRKRGTYRLIGVIPKAFENIKDLSFELIQSRIEKITGISVSAVNWFSTYHVHHRVADHFQKKSVFLLGDAAHIHSPAGGQGMNTGIGDAVNLAWKLAAVLQNRATPEILNTYEEERIPFAQTLVKTTDRLFTLIANTSMIGKVFREQILPSLIPLLLEFSATKHFIFRVISQIRIQYPHSVLSEGKAGGKRLPYLQNNFAALQTLDWQVHVYGKVHADFRKQIEEKGFSCYEFPWTAHASFLQKDNAYLVRPDGYIALDAFQDIEHFEAYITRWDLRSRIKC